MVTLKDLDVTSLSHILNPVSHRVTLHVRMNMNLIPGVTQ